MNGSQMILVLGAIVLFSFIIINVHRSILNSTELTLEAECIIAANAVASEMMNEICSKAFDEATVSVDLDEAKIPGSFTSLGLEGEAICADTALVCPTYDDIDDYNGYSRKLWTPRIDTLTANVSVAYADTAKPDLIVYQKTRIKRIEVAVTNKIFPDTLRLFYYSCY